MSAIKPALTASGYLSSWQGITFSTDGMYKMPEWPHVFWTMHHILLNFKGKLSWACWEARSTARINNSTGSKARIHTGSWETGNQRISPVRDWLYGRSSHVFLGGLRAVLTWAGSSGCNWLRLKTWMEIEVITFRNARLPLEGKEVKCFDENFFFLSLWN